jgi:hypothetical protein
VVTALLRPVQLVSAGGVLLTQSLNAACAPFENFIASIRGAIVDQKTIGTERAKHEPCMRLRNCQRRPGRYREGAAADRAREKLNGSGHNVVQLLTTFSSYHRNNYRAI